MFYECRNQNYFGIILGWDIVHQICSRAGEKIPPKDKLSARRMDTFYNQDRLAAFIVQIGQPIENEMKML